MSEEKIILGVDWGRARVGLAVCDGLGLMAHPAGMLAVKSFPALIESLALTAVEHRASEIVVGFPRNMDGTEGESAAAVRRFSEQLGAATGLPIVLWDERLSTWEAEKLLVERPHLSRTQKKEAKDQIAACLVLQSYLNSRRRPAP